MSKATHLPCWTRDFSSLRTANGIAAYFRLAHPPAGSSPDSRDLPMLNPIHPSPGRDGVYDFIDYQATWAAALGHVG